MFQVSFGILTLFVRIPAQLHKVLLTVFELCLGLCGANAKTALEAFCAMASSALVQHTSSFSCSNQNPPHQASTPQS